MKAEEQKYRLIVAIAAMFDKRLSVYDCHYIVAKILQAGAKDAKSVLTKSRRQSLSLIANSCHTKYIVILVYA